MRTGAAEPGKWDGGSGSEDIKVATLTMSGMAVLAAGGWLVRRRRRPVQPLQERALEAAAPQERESAGHPEPAVPPAQVEVAQPDLEPMPAVEAQMPPATVAPANAEPDASLSWAPDSDIGVNSSWAAATAPMPRPPPRISLATQKLLIRSLMWVRTAAGGAAILAAIAFMVFWSIETTDRRAGETGLNMALLLGALAGWALSWGAGQLANMLHRLFFNRVHPKFDT